MPQDGDSVVGLTSLGDELELRRFYADVARVLHEQAEYAALVIQNSARIKLAQKVVEKRKVQKCSEVAQCQAAEKIQAIARGMLARKRVTSLKLGKALKHMMDDGSIRIVPIVNKEETPRPKTPLTPQSPHDTGLVITKIASRQRMTTREIIDQRRRQHAAAKKIQMVLRLGGLTAKEEEEEEEKAKRQKQQIRQKVKKKGYSKQMCKL